MAQEIELKLQLTAKTARQLLKHPLLAALPAKKQDLLNTYYDTADLALTQRRIALRFRKKGEDWLLTVKSAEPAAGGLAVRSEWECPARPGEFNFSHVDRPDLQDFLEQRQAELTPIFTTHFRRTAWLVEHGHSQIELALDQGEVESCGRRDPISEIELELISGRISDLFALTRILQADLALYPAIASKAERGYALFHDTPPQPVKGRPVPLPADESPVIAFRRIALACLEHYQRNEAGLLRGESEYVHQARVALRKLRSALKLFSPVLPDDFVTTWSAAWRELATALGETRDWDVLLEDTLPPLVATFPAHPEIKRLLKRARRGQKQARRRLQDHLVAGHHPRQLINFVAAVLELPEPQPATDLREFAWQRLKKRESQALALAGAHARLDDREWHSLRIEIKKLRYALDFFSLLLPGNRLRAYQRALTQLQDSLGRFNDQCTALALAADCLGASQAGPVQGWLAGQHALLREILPEQLLAWQAQSLPKPADDE